MKIFVEKVPGVLGIAVIFNRKLLEEYLAKITAAKGVNKVAKKSISIYA